MIPRNMTREIQESSRQFPVVTITGPRQSGKTTLARSSFPEHLYVNFELPDVRAAFLDDPRGFLGRISDSGALFDEAQRVPDLFSWIQGLVDEDPRPGRFVLTGSQHFGLAQSVSQSLAGRTAVLELLPFALAEMEGGGYLADDLDRVLWAGSYPPVHDRGIDPDRWYAGYVATYLERDLRQVGSVQDLIQFQRFMALAAGSVGQVINATRLAGDVGVTARTIDRWLGLLEASYLVKRIGPYHRNFRKRLVKAPKLYFLDAGLVCHLLGIHEPEQLATHPLRGAVFENWVAAEILKADLNAGRRRTLSFWRTHDGQEVDLIREGGGRVDLVECKSGRTVFPGSVKQLERVGCHWTDEAVNRWLVFGGSEPGRIRSSRVVPWRRLTDVLANQV